MSESELYNFLQTLIVDIVTQVQNCSVSNSSCFLSYFFIHPYTIQANCLSYFSFLFLSNIKKFLFHSFPSVKIQKRYTSVAFTYFLVPLFERLQRKSEYQIETNILFTFFVHQTNKLRFRESLQTDTWSLCLGFTSLSAPHLSAF